MLSTWFDIKQQLSETYGVTFNFNPLNCIFRNVLQDTVRYPRSWDILFSTIILKKLILKYWKSKHPPTLLQWKKEMYHYLIMEKITASEKNK